MKEFVEYLLKNIVSKPENLDVQDVEDQGIRVIKVKVAQEDMGMVIGKEGKNIKSLRAMVKAKAIKDGIRVNLELVEETNDNL